VLVVLSVPLVAALSIAEWLRGSSFEDGFSTVVAGAINLIPEGLILLASIVYVTGALKMSRHGALVQQLNAVESLASADVVCTDKTGTLTEPRLRVISLLPTGVSEEELERAFGRYAASSEVRNSTLQALAEAFPATPETPSASVPFSSRWKWSAVRLDDEALVLGAPELFPLGEAADEARNEAASGRRVVAIASTNAELDGIDPAAGLPSGLELLGLATLSEELRPNTRETVSYFQDQDIALKVLSGDAPSTVATIATDAGIAGVGTPANGNELPENDEELRAVLRETAVVGRISPEGKKRVVEALRDDGRYVGMIGDGVNDVPALKASRVAIAQGSGAQMARTVSDLVLVRGDFGAVPRMVAEGRQILRNMQRVSKLFTTKCLFGAFIVLGLGLAPIEYPFLPRHLTLAGFFLTGIPTFILALAPSDGPWRMESFARSVFRFATPASFAIAVGTALSYVLALEVVGIDLEGSRTVALATFVTAFLYTIMALEATGRRRALWVGGLCVVLGLGFWIALAVPFAQDVFDVVYPDGKAIGLIVAGVAVAIGLLTAFRIRPGREYD
jgi:magnesium-transporting ATPase (P-type)